MIECMLTSCIQQLLKAVHVPPGFVLLPGGLGKLFKQGAPTSAAQLQPVRQPLYGSWDTVNTQLEWKEKEESVAELLRTEAQRYNSLMVFHNGSERRQELKLKGRGRENLWGCCFISTQKKNSEFTTKPVKEKIWGALKKIKKAISSHKVWNDQEGLKVQEQILLVKTCW